MKKVILFILLFLSITAARSQSVRESIRLDDGWKFAFGYAGDATKDFGCGTEYFNYLTKANSIHNTGPYSPKFDGQAGIQELAGDATMLYYTMDEAQVSSLANPYSHRLPGSKARGTFAMAFTCSRLV